MTKPSGNSNIKMAWLLMKGRCVFNIIFINMPILYNGVEQFTYKYEENAFLNKRNRYLII